MQKITPFLWYDDQAEEAANLYVSIFKDGEITHVTPGPGVKASWVSFKIMGQEFMALNGGPLYKFNEATSFFVSCDGQAEVDEYWNKLIADGGSEGNCGWCKDKFGVSWQIIPKQLSEGLANPDPAKSNAVMQAMLKMNKLIVVDLEKAAAGDDKN